MRDETESETRIINAVWKMARHTTCKVCERYKPTTHDRICRACARLVLETAAAQRTEGVPVTDDLTYYDN